MEDEVGKYSIMKTQKVRPFKLNYSVQKIPKPN